MRNLNTTKVITLSIFMFLGVFLGVNTPIDAQTGWYPCGRCDFETNADDPHLGDIGFCSYVTAGVVNGCTSNNGSACYNGLCRELKLK